MKNEKVEVEWIRLTNGEQVDESIFLKNAHYAYLYAKYHKKSRLSEAEEVIFYTDAKMACLYCWAMDEIPFHLHNFMICRNLVDMKVNERKWVENYLKFYENNKDKKKLT